MSSSTIIFKRIYKSKVTITLAKFYLNLHPIFEGTTVLISVPDLSSNGLIQNAADVIIIFSLIFYFMVPLFS